MDIIYWVILGMGTFVAIWMLFVAPSERRHHERKLKMLQKKIDARQARKNEDNDDAASDQKSRLEET